MEFILRRDPETNWWADREIEEGLRCCWCVKPGRCDIWKLFEGKWTFWSFLPDLALLTIPARVFHVCCPRSSVMFFPLRCARSSEPFVRISQYRRVLTDNNYHVPCKNYWLDFSAATLMFTTTLQCSDQTVEK